MRGCNSTPVFVVNAEIDSMGGVVEGGVSIVNKTSPQKEAIDKVQADLWQEYGVRDQHKKELEFLEKGGDPLDFKLWNGALVSVQSTSIADQHPHPFVTSEAKGIFAFTVSPHGDSAESSGRPGTNREPNSADNLMLCDVEHGTFEGGRSLPHPIRSVVAPTEQSFQVDGSRKTQECGGSATSNLLRKSYKRRYRSRPNSDVAKSSSTHVNPTRGCHGPRHVKELVSDSETQSIMFNPDSKPATILDDNLPKTAFANGQNAASYTVASKHPQYEQINQQLPPSSEKTPIQTDSNGINAIHAMGEITSSVIECQPSSTATKVENKSSSCQMSDFIRQKGNDVKSDAHNSNISRSIKVMDSESSFTQTTLSIDGNDDNEMCTRVSDVDHNGDLVIESDKCVEEDNNINGINNSTLVNKESDSACQSQQDNCFSRPLEAELNQSESGLENKVKYQAITQGMESYGSPQLDSGRKLNDPSVHNLGLQNETTCDDRHQDSVEVLNGELPESRPLTKASIGSVEAQISSQPESKLTSKIYEHLILKEAQIIKAKRKRIAELSVVTSPTEIRQKYYWDYVLEEMAWLANDFSQERTWKIAAASQICYRAAVSHQSRKPGQKTDMDAKTVAHTLAKAVMEFWQSVQSLETSKEVKQQHRKNGALSVWAYGARLLKCIKPNIFLKQAEMPSTPDRLSDLGVLDLSWEDNLTEENLFYAAPSGAGEIYRKSVESRVTHCEKTGCTVQEKVDTSLCDASPDFEYLDNAYYEDEGKTRTDNIPVDFESSKSSLYIQKKRKHSTHAYGPRTYEMGFDLCDENKVVSQKSALLVKRPSGTLNVSIPTKRMRTASRRVISPFTAGASGPNKTDVSSCDTNSFRDDRGLPFPSSLDVESVGEFESKLLFDSSEVSTRPKKKKKAKHMDAGYEQRWQVDLNFQNEQFQRDSAKKRSESRQFESNGNSGLLSQPMMKKSKLMRHSQDNSFDHILPSGGSALPAASQMSNMSNSNKFIKMLGGRDRGRKSKALKMPDGQPGSGSPWSLFEDQALVVLVHDLGPNWDLVCDAINGTLHFKYIFRKAKECKERHSFLMDGTSGDGAESAEDSGSSQPYPSTLPGIPKGSARQLFQRLQGPMEEDTIKSHFEKIIVIGQKPRYRRSQDPKQLQQSHSSHTVALSQVCPNNLNGGHILTPLDLCEDSGPDLLSLGYQGSHPNGLAIPNLGTGNPMLPASGASSQLQGSPNMMTRNNFSSSPGTLNSSSCRDGRYGGPRPGPLPADEQQILQPYNQMIPGGIIPQPNVSVPTDRGVHMDPSSGNGMAMMGTGNRSLPMARPGFPGLPPSPSVNPCGMGSPVMSSANMHAGIGGGQRSSMLKPPEILHMMRPRLNQHTQTQTMIPPDLQIGNTQVPPTHFSGLSPSFPNQTPQPLTSPYPLHHHPSQPISPQPPQVLSPRRPHFQGPQPNHPQLHQAYAIRVAKERQLQNRLLHQQQFPTQTNSSQVQQPQTSSPPTQGGGTVQNAPTGNSGRSTNQTAKQQQRQPQSQLNKQHLQQRQQAKVAKGVSQGNRTDNNIPTDASLLLNQPSSSDNGCQGPPQQKLANQNQPVLQKVVQINSDLSKVNKSQGRDIEKDRNPTSSSTEINNNVTNAFAQAQTEQRSHSPAGPSFQKTLPDVHIEQQQPQMRGMEIRVRGQTKLDWNEDQPMD